MRLAREPQGRYAEREESGTKEYGRRVIHAHASLRHVKESMWQEASQQLPEGQVWRAGPTAKGHRRRGRMCLRPACCGALRGYTPRGVHAPRCALSTGVVHYARFGQFSGLKSRLNLFQNEGRLLGCTPNPAVKEVR